jgi:hypothetical protein
VVLQHLVRACALALLLLLLLLTMKWRTSAWQMHHVRQQLA